MILRMGPKVEAMKKVIMDHVTKRVNVLTVQPQALMQQVLQTSAKDSQ